MPYLSPSSSSQTATYSVAVTGPVASAPPQDPANVSFTVTFKGGNNTDEATLDGVVQDFMDFMDASTDYGVLGGEKVYGTSQTITVT